jgi:P2 family phage contractile tail tube protein
MSIQVNRLTNGNMYINGNSYLGTIEEVNLPDVKGKYSEHKALGMNATVELSSGIDKMEAKIKFNAPYAKVMKLAANPTVSHSLMFRGNLETYEGASRVSQVPYKCIMKAGFKNVHPGNMKQHDNVEMESTLNVTYVKLEIDNEEIFEIDVLNNIHKVDGVDILELFRANLGI